MNETPYREQHLVSHQFGFVCQGGQCRILVCFLFYEQYGTQGKCFTFSVVQEIVLSIRNFIHSLSKYSWSVSLCQAVF